MAYFRQVQIRSADEPSTSFYKCVECATEWRENLSSHVFVHDNDQILRPKTHAAMHAMGGRDLGMLFLLPEFTMSGPTTSRGYWLNVYI